MNKALFSLLLLATIILLGTAGYHLIERYPLIDALYMSVITITTVGFGEIYPLSEIGRLFTIGLIISGFIVLGLFGSSVMEWLMEEMWSGKRRGKKMTKKIAHLKKHYIICGFGRVGRVAAEHLREAGADFVVIDNAPAACEELRELGFLHIDADATRESALLEARIKEASGLLALVHSDPYNLFIVLNARELNPTLHIIARSEDKHTEGKILKAGADAIVCPFESAGKQIADNLLIATGGAPVKVVERLEAHPEWIEVQEGSSMIGQCVAEVARSMGRDILGLRRGEVDRLQPPADLVLTAGDTLLVVSSASELISADEEPSLPKKVVIIDDNPVIVRLYARLFQKAGFHPLVTDSGDKGYTLILKEKPVAAVIDFMLPGLSGLEVCREVRRVLGGQIKLVVFTGDDNVELRQRCLQAGADEVVVKNAETAAIVTVVSRLVKQ